MSEAPLDADELVAGAQAVLGDEHDPVANAANLVAYLAAELPRHNWLGVYFVRGDQLVLGPFAGRPAVTRIGRGRGVCGTAWASAQTLVIDDVKACANHIACDLASQSEIVVPLVRDGEVVGVLDCDSPHVARFRDADRALFERLAALYLAASDFP